MNDIRYQDYYVAYIDILGFRDITEGNKSNPESIYRILNASRDIRIGSFENEGIQYLHPEQIKSFIMSDSIVYYIDSSIEDALLSLILNCTKLARALIMRDKPIFVRGSITQGEMFCKNDIIFGPALTKAYILEHNFSKNPRIIIDRKLFKQVREKLIEKTKHDDILNKVYSIITYKDEDEWDCVEYIHDINDKQKKELQQITNKIDKEIDKANDIKIREKMIYLYKHIKSIPMANK